ncbi:Aste57867_9892 [Aphanomyces stellatus]|uniref:Aste57867_9892 protein n=1 Tax=Aphanomyces stellatus TaxID=120398 RepID=A0A485KPM3_9STRA|nr:hypothetical protein As57867_009853 [Aphanomyces stellatus]VFT86771.1 Aste57867_9892 [Aphanomyces stellatus]
MNWTCVGAAARQTYLVRLQQTDDVLCSTRYGQANITCELVAARQACPQTNALAAAFVVPTPLVCNETRPKAVSDTRMLEWCAQTTAVLSPDRTRRFYCNPRPVPLEMDACRPETWAATLVLPNGLGLPDSACAIEALAVACEKQPSSSSVTACPSGSVTNISSICRVFSRTTLPSSTSPDTTPSPLMPSSSSPSMPSSNIPASPTSQPTSTQPTTVVAIAVTAVVLVLAFYFLYWRRRRRSTTVETPPASHNHTISDYYNPHTDDENDDDEASLGRPAADMKLVGINDLQLHRLNLTDLVVGSRLGGGGFGQVFLGTYRGHAVAIKQLVRRRQGQQHDVQCFLDELLLMATYEFVVANNCVVLVCCRFQSPYLVRFLGAAWKSSAVPEMRCVLEFMDGGDLRHQLKKRTAALFSWPAKLEIIHAIVSGLAYLHAQGVIHRDLKSRNVLLDAAQGAKLSDFGVSRQVTTDTMTAGVGTYRWMAPEVLQSSHYTDKADMYSLGMILTELDTHQIPFAEIVNSKGQPVADTVIMSMVVNNSVTIRFSDKMPTWLSTLAMRCVQRDSTLRPSAREFFDAMMRGTNQLSN